MHTKLSWYVYCLCRHVTFSDEYLMFSNCCIINCVPLSADNGLIKVCISLPRLKWIKSTMKLCRHSQYPAQQAGRLMGEMITGAK